MRRVRPLASLIALAALAGFFLIGCSELPTAPRGQGLAATTSAKPQRAAAPAVLLPAVGTDGLDLVVRTIDLVGSVGGSLTNGRWSVVMPAGAVDGNAVVGLAVESPSSPVCQLDILPADRNHFSVPAMLTVDCRAVPLARLWTLVIVWHDPATGAWVPVKGSKVDLVTRTVSAPLQHFSKYSVETKAGW